MIAYAAIAAAMVLIAALGMFFVVAYTEDRYGRIHGARATLALLAARARHQSVPGQESPANPAADCGPGAGALAGHLEPLERLATTGEQRAVREPVTASAVAAALKNGGEDEDLPVALQEVPAEDGAGSLYTDDSTQWRLMVGEIAGMGK